MRISFALFFAASFGVIGCGDSSPMGGQDGSGAGKDSAVKEGLDASTKDMGGCGLRTCASARSSVPGSSGLGNATVRKSGSGFSCASTTSGGGKPACSNACKARSPATPCSGV